MSKTPTDKTRLQRLNDLVGNDTTSFAKTNGLKEIALSRYTKGFEPFTRKAAAILAVKLNLRVNYFEQIPSHVEGLVVDSASVYPKRIATNIAIQPFASTNESRLEILIDHIGDYTEAEFERNNLLPDKEISKFTSGEVPFDKDSAHKLAERLNLPLVFFEGGRPFIRKKIDIDLSSKRVLKDSDVLSLNKLIGKRLKEERVKLHFPIHKFCDRLEIGTDIQLAYETGEATIPTSYLSLVKTIFEVDVKYILCGIHRIVEDRNDDSEARMFIIAERLKEERSNRKISQFDFASSLGVTLAMQTLYESGLEPIPASYLSHAAAIFKLDLEYILTF